MKSINKFKPTALGVTIAAFLLININMVFGIEYSNIGYTVAHNRLDSNIAVEKYIYLTFDDGPLEGSENIDSVILKEKLNVSVFLVGKHAETINHGESYVNMYKKNPFIEAYNHSYSHANDHYIKFYSNPQGVLEDVKKNEKLLDLKYRIVRLPGRNMWRLPGGRRRDDISSGKEAADLLYANGFKVYGWDIEWTHYGATGEPVQSVKEIKKLIEDRLMNSEGVFTKDHIVVLVHDEMFRTKWEKSELKQLIDELRADGKTKYIFEHIRNYPNKAE